MLTALVRRRRLLQGGFLLIVAGLLWQAKSRADTSGIALPDRLSDLITLSSSVIIEALPFVLLGVSLSVLVQLFLSEKTLLKFLPKHSFPRRLMLSLTGSFLPVCECGNVPLARGLMIRGLSVGEAVTFLLAAPIINPVTILATSQAFRLDSSIVIIRVVAAFLIANIVGSIIAYQKNPEKFLTKRFRAQCAAPPAGVSSKKHAALDLFRHELADMMPALIVGALIAGLSQVFIPRSVLLTFGSDPVLSILAMLALAFIISICANVDAFFALAFNQTFTAGSIVSFLVFGPMIDIKMLSLLRTTFTWRFLIFLSALVAGLSILTGLVVNYAF
jgi:uncharacterized protein